ncbi:AAA family ATPase [Vibrio parahaemolyticus]|uniref:AAA family ATPase n=1 Tax=Vibrio parahaemolyticus TaxID=670 RepID=UPI001D5AD9EF|nr:ATP-binding protein [Vibrio parahaemolyticus]MBE5128765.1 ATP-binding protein [Vibrio parahaemolyticus]HCG6671732.1 ATP-binding protein [Vibrio parahaemolyticus]
MIIRLAVENYMSICSRQVLDMEPGSYTEKAETNTFEWHNGSDSQNLLNTTAIYGANASGKSNLISAFGTMRSIVANSAQWQVDKKLPYRPYKLNDSRNAPTEFEVEFILDQVRYLYGFSYNKERILSEYLFAYPKKKPQKWFLRAWDGNEYKWDLGRSLSGEKQTWVKSTKENSLFLSTAVQLNSSQLREPYSWFIEKIAIASVEGWSSGYTARQCDKPEEKEKIINLLREVDIEVDDIEVESEEFDINKLPDEMPTLVKEQLAEKLEGEVLYDTKFVRKDEDGKPVTFDMDEESDGTNRFFSFAGPWLDALKSGKTLFVDELNSNLHPLLVKHMVQLFHCKKSNPNNAQLIFTTHETSILNQSVFRRDQVWFMQKNGNKSELYSLSEFKVRKDSENLEERYLTGAYGALPFIFWGEC